MKSLVRSFSVFFLLFSFSILFLSCSQESAITSPNESKVTAMDKTAVVPTGSINHSTDTLITFPKSGKTLVVGKNANIDQLALLDTYLQTHTISDKPATNVSPMLGYYTDTVSYWELEQQYNSVSGRHMGIWVTPDVISYTQAYNQYGFNELAVQPGEISTALGINFKADSLMMLLPDGQLATDMSDIQGNSTVGYYYIDEPYERNVSNGDTYQIGLYLLQNKPKSKLMISDYKWPEAGLCNGYLGGDGTQIKQYLPFTNCGIMSDLYVLSDACGLPDQYWNEYWNYYSPQSWMNWINNVGSGESNWPYCFNWMNVHGISQVWLYASEAGNEGIIQDWCVNAWKYGWLYRLEKYLVIVYQCSGTNCVYGVSGTWTVKTAYYTSSQYVSY